MAKLDKHEKKFLDQLGKLFSQYKMMIDWEKLEIKELNKKDFIKFLKKIKPIQKEDNETEEKS
jgi:hypothetical protein